MKSDHHIDPFVPRRSLTSGHAMTLFGWGNPRYFPRLPQPTVRYFDVDHDARVLAHCHWQRQPWEHPTILLLHGLNASSDAHYMRGIATKAFTRGMNVVRLNQRNCGNTEHLSAGLFHSGLTTDAKVVVNELSEIDGLTAISVAGYSLGGNLALKLAGEYGDRPPAVLRSVAAVSPILEISVCVHALERPANIIYQWNFVRDLKRRMRRKERFWPGRFDLSDPHGPPVRRCVHGATLRLRGRRGLLSPRQRDARHRSDSRARPHHHGRGRSVRAARAVPRSECDRQPVHHADAVPPWRPLRVRRSGERRGRRVLGRESDRELRRAER
jgi:pimeloyl-ACP methyl ester carboxylesterase